MSLKSPKENIPDFDGWISIGCINKEIRDMIEARLLQQLGLKVVHRDFKKVERQELLFFAFTREVEDIIAKIKAILKEIGLHGANVSLNKTVDHGLSTS